MSTRSRIAIIVKNDDLNKTFKATPDLLHLPLNTSENKGNVDYHTTLIEKPVLSIYHHWDGYPDGVGEVLANNYKDYDQVLNLILFGDASSICGGSDVTFYNSWRGEGSESWVNTKPSQKNSVDELVADFLGSDQEYLYLFSPDENGVYRWTVIEKYADDDSPKDLCKLLGIEQPETENKMYVLICQTGESITVEAVSKNEEKLKSLMKEKIISHLEDIYGDEEDLDPDCDDYELDLFKSARELTKNYWSDGDDELPVEFYIQDAEQV